MENTYHCYANRELSWLRFNERVLEEAEDSRLPLCERLSFLSIFQSNLDEFFMVRIGSLQDQMLLDKNARENKTNMTSGEQIDAALAFIHKLTARRDAAYNGLLEQLAEQGIRLLDFAHMEEESRAELEKLFRQDYLPLLSSFIISKKQAFPFLKNKGIYAVAVLSTKAEKKKIGIVPCGSEIFPRLVPVPGRTGCFILSEELILHILPLLLVSQLVVLMIRLWFDGLWPGFPWFLQSFTGALLWPAASLILSLPERRSLGRESV